MELKILNQKHIPKITGFPFLDLPTRHTFPASTTLFLQLLSLLPFLTKPCKPKSFHTWPCCYSMIWDLKLQGCLLTLILQVVKPLPSAAVNSDRGLTGGATVSQHKGRQEIFSWYQLFHPRGSMYGYQILRTEVTKYDCLVFLKIDHPRLFTTHLKSVCPD